MYALEVICLYVLYCMCAVYTHLSQCIILGRSSLSTVIFLDLYQVHMHSLDEYKSFMEFN